MSRTFFRGSDPSEDIFRLIRKKHDLKNKKKPKEPITGWISCPHCLNRLYYRISEKTGHINGACRTEGCVLIVPIT